MAKQTVYLETSVIGYATSRPSRDLIVAARQQLTRDWFASGAPFYKLFVSQIVIGEVASGDDEASQARIALIDGVPSLAVSEPVVALASKLVENGAIPRKSAEDALHIAVAAVHAVDFLLTWNFKHIANAAMRHSIERVCRHAGYEPPVICTPEELLNEDLD